MVMQKLESKKRVDEELDLVFLDVHGEVLSFDEVLKRLKNARDQKGNRKFAAG